jgi:hypothetical protein
MAEAKRKQDRTFLAEPAKVAEKNKCGDEKTGRISLVVFCEPCALCENSELSLDVTLTLRSLRLCEITVPGEVFSEKSALL